MEAAVKRVELDYSPRRVFLPFHYRKQRFAAIVAHRRCGKTVACINELIKAAVTTALPDGRFAYIAPLFNQAKDVAWTYLKHYSEPLLADKPNESELRVDLINGARIRLYGADNPDRLRGIYLDGVVLDEYADMHPSVWGSVIRPLLADRQGWAVFIGTPKGRNSFHEIYDRATRDAQWFDANLRASETGIVPAAELAAARLDMTEEQYAQEFENSFDAAILGAYFGKEIAEAERAGRITAVPYDPAQPVHTAWDLGVRDATAIWFFQALHGGVNIIDHYEATGQGLPHFAKVLRERGYGYGKHYVPHDAKVREWGSDRTRIEAMQALKLEPWIVADHALMDGINAARMTLAQCRFDREKCAEGLECLRQYRAEYDEKKRILSAQPRHDFSSHSADAFRYLSMAWRELKGEAPKPPPPKHAYEADASGVIRSGQTFNELVAAQARRMREREE